MNGARLRNWDPRQLPLAVMGTDNLGPTGSTSSLLRGTEAGTFGMWRLPGTFCGIMPSVGNTLD